jgi:hypothetical protein
MGVTGAWSTDLIGRPFCAGTIDAWACGYGCLLEFPIAFHELPRELQPLRMQPGILH